MDDDIIKELVQGYFMPVQVVFFCCPVRENITFFLMFINMFYDYKIKRKIRETPLLSILNKK